MTATTVTNAQNTLAPNPGYGGTADGVSVRMAGLAVPAPASRTTVPAQDSGRASGPFLRKATDADLEGIMEIIEGAREVLRKDGIPQWQNGNPHAGEVKASIDRGIVYVYSAADGRIIGTASIVPAPDPNYERLYKGTWSRPTEGYAVIHRFAVSPAFAGQHMGTRMLEALVSLIRHRGHDQARIDTHEKNARMRHLIEKAGFSYVGEIRVAGEKQDAERYTYEMLF